MTDQINYVRSDAQGRIIQWGTMRADVVASVESEGFIPGQGTTDTHYVANGVVFEKATCPAYLDGMTLRNVPVPATLTIDGTTYEATEPTIELSFNLPGTYKLLIESIPHLTLTLEVTV